MSDSTDSEFDLEQLFLPSWAKQSAATNRYENFSGDSDKGDRRGRGRGRERGPGSGPGNRRPEGGGFGNRRPEGAGRGPRRPDRGGRDSNRSQRPDRQRDGSRPRAPRELAPFPEVEVTIMPDDHGVDSLAKQIRMTGRAYPLFDIARMILQKPDRHGVTVSVKKDAEGKPIQPLFSCAIDQSVWLSEEDAVRHVLSKHFELFYQAERTAIDPPKGVYTFVAQCGMSGVILGPPNHHDYQNQLRQLHTRRFSRMPFETYKSRVKIVRDEEVVKKWIEDQSFTTEFNCLNLAEPLKLKSREEVEKHFRETHLANIIQPVDSVRLKGADQKLVQTSSLLRLIRKSIEDQRHFPLQVATVLSQQFASRGLQFFKVNRTITHVCVARPHYLDMVVTPVSDGIKRIVDFINERQRCTRKDLLVALAPSATPVPAPVPAEPPAAAPVDKVEASATEPGEAKETTADTSAKESPETPAPAPVHAVSLAQPTAEESEIITNLHWLIHQGHVIEFANGVMETAKKPLIKPAKPKEKKKAPAQKEAGSKAPVAPGSSPEAAVGGAEAVGETAVKTPEPEKTAEASVETPVETDKPAAPEAPAVEMASTPAQTETAEAAPDTGSSNPEPSASSENESEKPDPVPSSSESTAPMAVSSEPVTPPEPASKETEPPVETPETKPVALDENAESQEKKREPEGNKESPADQ